jgi:thioredoxin-like negative regulator of GroEL
LTSLMLAGVMSLSFMALASEPEAETYAKAYKAIVESGRPIVVMVGTDWCAPCQAMKCQVLPELRKRRWFGQIAFARVNVDREAALAKRLTGGGPVPQMVMFRRTQDGWVRRKLVGRQSVETVERFVQEGLAMDAATKKTVTGRLTARQQIPPVVLPEDVETN